MPAARRTVLILGGTGEAARLATLLSVRPELRVVTSLAGRTASPAAISGETRIGGFGGVRGLARYLGEEGIDVLVDATHPFAETISAHARAAAAETETRLLVLERAAWEPMPGDRWTVVRTFEEAAVALPKNARVFLALGSQHLAPFAERRDVHFIVRMVDEPAATPPLAFFEVIAGLPGRTAGEETALFERFGVEMLVSRNSGGRGAYAKIEAARGLRLPVVMIARPESVTDTAFTDVDAIAGAITERV